MTRDLIVYTTHETSSTVTSHFYGPRQPTHPQSENSPRASLKLFDVTLLLSSPGVPGVVAVYSRKYFGHSLLSINDPRSLAAPLELQLLLHAFDAFAVMLGAHRGVLDFPRSRAKEEKKSVFVGARYKHVRIKDTGKFSHT